MSSWKELRPSNFDGTSSPAIVVRWRILPAHAKGAAIQMAKVYTLSYRTKTRQSPWRFSEFRIAWTHTHTELRNHHNLDTLRASCRLRMAIYQTKLINLKPLGDLELFLACYLSCQLHLQVSSKDHWISHVGPMETGIGTPMRPAMMLAHLKSRILVLLDRE